MSLTGEGRISKVNIVCGVCGNSFIGGKKRKTCFECKRERIRLGALEFKTPGRIKRKVIINPKLITPKFRLLINGLNRRSKKYGKCIHKNR